MTLIRHNVLVITDTPNNFAFLASKGSSVNPTIERTLAAAGKKINKEHYDLIILQNKINGASSLPFLTTLRKTHTLTPIVIAYENISSGDAIRFANENVSLFFQLPAAQTDVLDLIARYAPPPAIECAPLGGDRKIINELSMYIYNREDDINGMAEICDRLAWVLYSNDSTHPNKLKPAIYESLRSASEFGCRSSDDKLFVRVTFSNSQIQVCVRDPGSGFDYRAKREEQKKYLSDDGNRSNGDYGLELVEYLADNVTYDSAGSSLNFILFVDNAGQPSFGSQNE